MSAASAHTVKPSLGAPGPENGRGPKRKISLKLVALVALSAAVGLAGAVGASRLRARPAPVMQIVSGNPALKSGSDGERVRWHSLTNKVYFDSSLDKVSSTAREAVQLGFGTWLGSGAKVPGLQFDTTEGAKFTQTPNGKSEVMYGPITLAGHERDLALTITFSDPKTGEVVESDMIFNSNHPYGLLPYKLNTDGASGITPVDSTVCEQRYDLQSVATHEAGHFFGLGEDFDDKAATMFYTTGRCETNKRVLQSSDETTMSGLYVNNDVSASSNDAGADPTAKGCGGARIGQGKTDGAVPLLSLAGLLGFVAMRRRRR